ncbi:MAG TPA: hypothetical protein VHT27_13125 [Solirubrobacteraceae bacterium]|jgi:hypothetical protein|nr:hypothetical protein [Solirubrobacteraceae bacterium]
MASVGEKLKRTKRESDYPSEVTIVGVKGGKYVCQAVETFSSPFELWPNELAAIYGGDGELTYEPSEVQSWKEITPKVIADACNFADTYAAETPLRTPEESLAEEAAEEAQKR